MVHMQYCTAMEMTVLIENSLISPITRMTYTVQFNSIFIVGAVQCSAVQCSAVQYSR